MNSSFLGILRMPSGDPEKPAEGVQRQQEQSLMNKNKKPEDESLPALREETPNSKTNGKQHHMKNDQNTLGDQGSTQSSNGESSGDTPAESTSAQQTKAAPVKMGKGEKGVSADDSQNSEVPERGLFRKESSRKSVQLREPRDAQSWGSNRSLDIGESTDDFFVDARSNRAPERQLDRADSEESMTQRSFYHELMDLPTEDNWDKTRRSPIWRLRIICGKVVENAYVQLGIIALIVVNAIFMGIATFDFVTDDPSVKDGFDALDRAFLVIFTIELGLQLVYRSLSYFTDAWLVFDFVIVIISWSLESLQIVRAFRIFRAFRLVTRIGPLRELVMAIGAVMPRMYAIAMLLILIFYIFAVLFTELFSEVNTEVNYFGSLDVSLFTCMQLMTLEWGEVAREVMEEKSWAWAPILAFLSVTGFIVFNLIVAVVCDAVAVVDREVQAEKLGEFETDTTKLEKAQERIWDMTEHVERMMHAQKELQEVLTTLAADMEAITKESENAESRKGRNGRRRG